MDIGYHRVPKSTMTNHKRSQKGKQKDETSLKVVYISSPMKVRTSTTRFRALVQQLTGKNSDVAQYMDDHKATDVFFDNDGLLMKEVSSHQILSSTSDDTTTTMTTTTTTTTTTTSHSFLEPVDYFFNSQLEEQFAGVFSCGSFSHFSQMDLLGSYDD